MRLHGGTVATIMGRPVWPAKCLLEALGHGVSALTLELRWALSVGVGLIAQGSKIEVLRGIGWMVNLTLERIESISQFFDVSGKAR
jgi:hypothetical protein